ncbi:MAG: AGE family epimerase/isomerase [Lachnospiraceae bacterium]|nr:AGE family epimerase/isomerase [Lachnospiraceae bacterium]
MDQAKFQEVHKWIKEELTRCTQFWLAHGQDREHGGVFTCLDRKGEIYSTDKSVWMQGRCGWIFSYLCTVYGKKVEWLNFSKSCIDFLNAHCVNHGAGDRLYFTVTGDGKPLRQRRYFFSEDFYTIANAEYYANTGDEAALAAARKTYHRTWDLRHDVLADPVGMPPKTDPETRKMRSFGDPMIYLNVTNVMKRCDKEQAALYEERADACVDEIIRYHYKPDLKCVLETTAPDGTPLLECTAGRVVNPGHDIEGSWFLADQANATGDKALHETAQRIFKNALEAGWDKEYGGLLYFIDCKGYPPEAYEHDMKLWWPHNEMLIATLRFYLDTQDDFYLDWFYKTADYCKTFFADPEYGEWYGYLRRDGKPTEPPCKGSTFKGPFHVPRSLIIADKLMEEVLAKQAS